MQLIAELCDGHVLLQMVLDIGAGLPEKLIPVLAAAQLFGIAADDSLAGGDQ